MASTIRHWKRWSRIGIVSRIKIIRESGEWSGAKKTEKNFQCYSKWRKTFYDLGNIHDCNNGISSIHGKELPEQLIVNPLWTRQISHLNKCSTYLRDWYLNKMTPQVRETIGWEKHSWKYLSLIDDDRIINLQRAKVYVFFGFCIVSWKDPSKSRCQRSLEEEDRMDHNFSKLQRLWRNHWRADWIRVEHLPRIRYVAALR